MTNPLRVIQGSLAGGPQHIATRRDRTLMAFTAAFLFLLGISIGALVTNNIWEFKQTKCGVPLEVRVAP